MDAATLQAKIYSGFGKAAQRTGFSFDLYRPTAPLHSPPTPNFALSPLNKIGSMPASFTPGSSGHNFEKASGYKDPMWIGLFDGSLTQPGDYLVNADHGTYFIAAMQDQLPILCVNCGHLLDIVRRPVNTAIGALDYNGTTEATEARVMTQWPGSVIFGQRGRVSEVGLPMDLPSPFFTILLPAYPGVILRTGDVVKDDLDQRYIVASAELSALGWRLSAQTAVT